MLFRGNKLGAPLALAAVTAMAAAVPMPAIAQTVQAAPRDMVQIATGRGRLVTLNAPMSDIFVADPAVADVQVRSPTQLWVFGKKAGETTVYATTKAGRVIYSANVRIGNNFDSVQSMLSIAMPDATIAATPMNGLVLLTGTVAAPQDAAEAERLVQAFVGEETKVLSRLKTATPLQVNLQVRFAEVSRSFVKNVGVNLTSVDSTGGFKFGIGQGRPIYSQFTPGGPLGVGTQAPAGGTAVTRAGTGSSLFGAGKLFGLDILSALDLGETIGQVTTLTNPNLTALSGETSTFLAGGEIPIPISQGSIGGITVEYKQYGVSLAYTPTVLSDGRISLRVRPEVSQLNYSQGVQMGGTLVPGLSTRRAETTVELGSGQSFVIAGLLQNIHDNTINKTPGLGDVPILGALFRSNAFQRGETELVIVVTPYLVKPVNANEIVLPTDGYKAPTDLERVFMGELGGGKTGLDRPKPRMEEPAPGPAASAAAPAGSQPLAQPQPQSLPQPQPPLATQVAPAGPAGKGNNRKKGSAAAAPGFSIN